MGERVFEHRPAAHRLADQPYVGEAQVIDQGGEIAGIVCGIGAARDRVGWREAAMGEGDARIVGSKMGDLLPPAHLVAAEPVGEEQGRAAAGHLVVEVAEGSLQFADRPLHAAPSRRGSA